MSLKFKNKLTKSLLKFLAIPVLFGAAVGSTVYGISNINASSNFNTNHNKVIMQDDTITNDNQPTINDVVNGDVSSLSQTIITADGNYILPTLTTEGIPGILKANSFVAELYGLNFAQFQNYHVRQIVQNYNNQTQYFVLLVNNDALVTAAFSAASYSFNIINPGHVLAVEDTGSSFSITADYLLDQPVLDNNMLAYYAGMYFQAPMDPNLKQSYRTGYTYIEAPWNLLEPSENSITLSGRSNMFPSGIFTTANTRYKNINDTWLGYSQNIVTNLYLNSLNNMVFVSDNGNQTNSDAIYLFGGNQMINLWFYTFNVNTQDINPDVPINEFATGYANYRVHFAEQGGVISNIDSSDIDTQKAYNFNLNINDTGFSTTSSWNNNPYPNASFFGYYVAGAKYVDQPNPQIEIGLTIPNFALLNNNMPVVFSTNVSIDLGNRYRQPPQSRVLNLYGAISVNSALASTQYRNQQNLGWKSSTTWVPSYRNKSYNFINVLSRESGILQYDITDQGNDGYQSRMYNKLVAYVPENSPNGNVIFKYIRNQMTAVVTDKNNKTTYTTALPLFQSKTRMDDLTNISFSKDTWFLTYQAKGATQATIYSFSYNSTIGISYLTQTNLILDNNLNVLNILPLSSKFIYILAQDPVNHKITPLLYMLTATNGNYEFNNSFNNLIANDQVVKTAGIPAYANDGVQNADQKAIWGTVSFQNYDYIKKAGFLSNPASFLVANNEATNTLVNYKPGWDGQTVKVTSQANDNNQLVVQVSIEYFNGLYYSPQELSSQNALTQIYAGFSALPDWVLPVAIAVPIGFLAIVLALGLGIGIPLAKSRKIQDKGFYTTFKKVDTLTAAIGSVYKKIAIETRENKKKLAMLEANKTKKAVLPQPKKSPAKTPNAPVTPQPSLPPARFINNQNSEAANKPPLLPPARSKNTKPPRKS